MSACYTQAVIGTFGIANHTRTTFLGQLVAQAIAFGAQVFFAKTPLWSACPQCYICSQHTLSRACRAVLSDSYMNQGIVETLEPTLTCFSTHSTCLLHCPTRGTRASAKTALHRCSTHITRLRSLWRDTETLLLNETTGELQNALMLKRCTKAMH